MLDRFTRHPASVGESYFQHLCAAWSFGFTMAFGAGACLLHGLFPFLFERTGSAVVSDLHGRMRRRIDSPTSGAN